MAKIDNDKMWESLRNSLWHFPQEEWLIRCIDNALWEQGLQYNSDTKKIESIVPKPEYYKTRKEMTKESSDGELTEFESEIAHILVYVNNEPTDTDEERKRAYQKYAKNAKFFAPLLLEKARKQKPADNEMIEILRAEYEKGRADAIVEMQNPAWSEGDENNLRVIVDYLIADNGLSLKHIDWLKSLKDRIQPRQEWSNEEKNRISRIIAIIRNSMSGTPDDISWLKSLRPQNTWKPSDEQMNGLKEAIEFLGCTKTRREQLQSLYEQLKKLKEIKL